MMKVNEIFIVKVGESVCSYRLEYSRLECGTVDWTCHVYTLNNYIGVLDFRFNSTVEAMNFLTRVAVQRAYELRQILDFKEIPGEKESV